MSDTTEITVAIAETGNTIPNPPRLIGRSEPDAQAMAAWVADLHRTLAREANVIGTQKALIEAVNALSRLVVVQMARIADLQTAALSLDARLDIHDGDTTLFNALAIMPASVSGSYVGAELAAAYDKINQIIAILRNP